MMVRNNYKLEFMLKRNLALCPSLNPHREVSLRGNITILTAVLMSTLNDVHNLIVQPPGLEEAWGACLDLSRAAWKK